MKPCPRCGNYDYREARQCPQYEGEPVCIRCCHECDYYDPDPLGLTCRYHLSHPKTNWELEIKKIDQQITYAETRVRRLYELNWPKKAERLEVDVRNLMVQKKKLEEKKSAENKKAGRKT